MYECQNFDVANSLFEDKLAGILNQMIPIRRTQARRKPAQWLDNETKSMMNRRDTSRNFVKQTDDDLDWEHYKN